MEHPAELAQAGLEKRGWFWAALPYIMMGLPMVTSLIEKFRGGGAGGVQLPRFDPAQYQQKARASLPTQVTHSMFGGPLKYYNPRDRARFMQSRLDRPVLSQTADQLHQMGGVLG